MKLTELEAASSLVPGNLIYVVQSGVSKKATVSQIGQTAFSLAAIVPTDQSNLTTTPASLPASLNFDAGDYCFRLVVFGSESSNADPFVFDFDGGTVTASQFSVSGYRAGGPSNNLLGPITTLAGDLSFGTPSSDNLFILEGAIRVSVAGTFIPRFWKGTTLNPAVPVIVKALSSLIAWRIG